MGTMSVCSVINVEPKECEEFLPDCVRDATDCLRSVKGKLEWFERKQRYCPNLVSVDDSAQVKTLIDKLTAEETPVLEFDHKLSSKLDANASSDLQIKVKLVCDQFIQIKKMLQLLNNNIEITIRKQNFVTL